MGKRPHRTDNGSADEVELVPLTGSSLQNPASSSEDASFFTVNQVRIRSLVILVVVMVGCYDLGRRSCFMEHEKEILEGGSQKAKNEPKSQKRRFTRDQIRQVRVKSLELLTSLDDYYNQHQGGASNILLGDGGWATAWSIDRPTPDSKEEKLIDTMARALLSGQEAFQIGVIGSSVAAGHDNCRYDNYQEQLERLWAPLWQAAGMSLVIQNAGQGGGCGDSHRNQVWCIQQNVSPDVDIVHYSWSYFEVGDPTEGRNERESLVRWTQLLPKAPPVHVVNVLFDKGCFTNHPPEVELLQTYQAYGYNAFCMRYAIISGQLREVTGSEDPIFEGQHVGDGFHNTTRYGLNESNQERKDSLGVVMRNWHPGPLGFQYITDAMAYTYTTALLAALDRIESVLDPVAKTLEPHNASAPDAAWWKDRPIVMGRQLNKPLWCDPQYCVVDQAPKCLNLELPTFGYWGASIAPSNDDLNPYKGELQAWQEFSQFQESEIMHMVNRLEASLFANKPEMCQFPDYCAAIEAQSADQGRVAFKLPKMEVGMVALCFCCGKEVAKEQVMDNAFLEVEFNGRVLNRTSWDVYPNGKCVRVVKEHGTAVGATGHAYLSVRLLEGNTETVRISHVITI